MIVKIISGAQTGADQAGLSAAVKLGLDRGGFIPLGRRTDSGPLSQELMDLWKLTEHTSSSYPPRTWANVKLGDGTVLFGDITSPGSRLTMSLCVRHNRPYLVNPRSIKEFRQWVKLNRISVLNVAGNREKTNPGIFNRVEKFLIDGLSNENSGLFVDI